MPSSCTFKQHNADIGLVHRCSRSRSNLAVATKGYLSARSLKLSTWMGDLLGRPGAVNLGPFVGLDLKLSPVVYVIAVLVLART